MPKLTNIFAHFCYGTYMKSFATLSNRVILQQTLILFLQLMDILNTLTKY